MLGPRPRGDLRRVTATTFTAQLSQINVPVVLVIKKNSSTLKNLLEWLKEHSVHQSTQMVSQPMLLIDDEADNASINTAYQRDEVTRINSQIRELLSLFHRSCYVGYARETFRLSRPDQKLPKTVNPRIYRQVPGRRPLLILRLVKPKLDDPTMPEGVLVWGLSFPSSRIGGGTVEYFVNTIRMREMFGEEEIEEEALGDPE